MISGLSTYMNEKGLKTLDDITGQALPNVTDWENLDLNYRVTARIKSEKCTGCRACFTACEDGAYQAIKMPENPAVRIPVILEDKCVGCNLCLLVCPVKGCISMVPKEILQNY
jgi:dihydropyrimidine dehydrogenase (NAD+) subunit PreA